MSDPRKLFDDPLALAQHFIATLDPRLDYLANNGDVILVLSREIARLTAEGKELREELHHLKVDDGKRLMDILNDRDKVQRRFSQLRHAAQGLLSRCRECADDSWNYPEGDQFEDWVRRVHEAMVGEGDIIAELRQQRSVALDMAGKLAARNEALQSAIRQLYQPHEEGGIMHGDAEHKRWLADYLDKHFAASLPAKPSGPIPKHDWRWSACSKGGLLICDRCRVTLCSPPWGWANADDWGPCEPKTEGEAEGQ